MPGLPEQADFRHEVIFLPCFVILHEVGQQVVADITMHETTRPNRIGQPGAVTPRLRAGGAKPVASVIAREARIAKPAHLV